MTVVLDASAVLSVLWNEPGCDVVLEHIDGGLISAVNHAEVMSKIDDRGVDREGALSLLAQLAIDVIAFDKDQANSVGELRSKTRQLGLSLGDRACLALALSRRSTVLTADKAWSKLNLDIEIQIIR